MRDTAHTLSDFRAPPLDRMRTLRPARPLQYRAAHGAIRRRVMTLMAVLLERKRQSGQLPARLEDRFVTADADYAKGGVVRVWYAISAVS
jgi:hypothetical protein